MRTIFLFLAGSALLACTNNARNKERRKPAPDAVFYDYQVWGEEGDSAIMVTFQYHGDGGDGPAQKLIDSVSILLDGKPMTADSSQYNGIIYESIQPAGSFIGAHNVSFMDNKGKAHKEEFRFEPFALAGELPEQVKKEPFTIKLKNFPPEPGTVRLTITDTSYASRDVNEEVQVVKGELTVNANQLANLVAGPVTLEIYRENERPLKQTAKEGGRVLMMYALRREFELVQ